MSHSEWTLFFPSICSGNQLLNKGRFFPDQSDTAGIFSHWRWNLCTSDTWGSKSEAYLLFRGRWKPGSHWPWDYSRAMWSLSYLISLSPKSQQLALSIHPVSSGQQSWAAASWIHSPTRPHWWGSQLSPWWRTQFSSPRSEWMPFEWHLSGPSVCRKKISFCCRYSVSEILAIE